MQGDAALSEELRRNFLPDPTLSGAANVLILPNLDAANILFNVLKVTGGAGVTVGPILLGAAAPVHILTPSSTVRRLVNMTALAVAAPVAEHRAARPESLALADSHPRAGVAAGMHSCVHASSSAASQACTRVRCSPSPAMPSRRLVAGLQVTAAASAPGRRRAACRC